MSAQGTRARLAALALALAAIASVRTEGEPEALLAEAAQGRAAPPATPPAALHPYPAAALDPSPAFVVRPLPEMRDAFGTRNWQPPAPPAKPAPQAKPAAPPLPFAYLGRLEEGAEVTVYLRRGEEVVVARAGQAIDANYRLDEAGEDRLVFTYLPLRQQQMLGTGAAR